MRLYLEPSVLVKLFKKEPDSARMVDLLGAIDERRDWFACTSRWSLLEVARALKKDGKPKELIELNLRELKRHRISLIEVTRKILSDSEIVIASHSIYASDALHVATYSSVARVKRLAAMLSDDRHFKRLGEIVNVLTLSEVSSDTIRS
ncbi:PIN domain-containing protein [Candidatus Bathyarchaeota archaeon]|nr:PIN domain-containing protein [Candidatus Bathyarchaeota archaeon]